MCRHVGQIWVLYAYLQHRACTQFTSWTLPMSVTSSVQGNAVQGNAYNQSVHVEFFRTSHSQCAWAHHVQHRLFWLPSGATQLQTWPAQWHWNHIFRSDGFKAVRLELKWAQFWNGPVVLRWSLTYYDTYMYMYSQCLCTGDVKLGSSDGSAYRVRHVRKWCACAVSALAT